MREGFENIARQLVARMEQEGHLEKLLREVQEEALRESHDILKELTVRTIVERATGQVRSMLESVLPQGGDGHMFDIPPHSPAEVGYYVYGIVPVETDLPEVTGVETDSTVYGIDVGPLRAIVSLVDLNLLGPDVVNERISDRSWLESSLRAHQHVQDLVMPIRTLVPMRFATVFRSEEDIRDFLSRHEQELLSVLEQLAGRQEWGVKVYVHRIVLIESILPQLAGVEVPNAEASPGKGYFERRKRDRLLEEEIRHRQVLHAEEINDRLSSVAERAVVLPLQQDQGGERTPVLNAAYLLKTENVARFEEELVRIEEEYASMGFGTELTGPWPPYNFVDARFEV